MDSIFTVADYLLTRLKQLDVTEVFQIPGDYCKHFTQALEHFDGVHTIAGINELDAGYAADAYARTRGLAALSLQYGVSTFSALNAVAGAYVERSPIVVISATPGTLDRNAGKMFNILYHHSTGHLEMDRDVYARVTVGAEIISSNSAAAETIDRLLVAAITHHRPVYIACWEEVWGEPCPPPPRTPLKPEAIQSNKLDVDNAVTAAWQQISAAKSPIILAGVELLRFGLAGLLEQIIQASGFLYTTTTLGKTVLDEDGKVGEKFLGTYSDAASTTVVQDAITNSDCIIALGTIITDDYNVLMNTKYPLMVRASTEEIRAGYSKYHGVTMAGFMEGLLRQFKTSKGYPKNPPAPPAPVWPEPWRSNSDPKYDGTDVMTYNRFFEIAMPFLKKRNLLDEIVFTLGVSSSMYVATNAYGLKQNSYISSAAWQCIGFETGAVCGAQMGSKTKRAWALAGDGGFMMVCQSLSTLARNKLNGVIFVMSNAVYAIEQIYVNIDAFQTGKFDSFDILPKWNYKALAEAFGAQYYQVVTVNQLEPVLEEVRQLQGRPALVELVVPEKDLPRQMERLGNEPLI